MDYWTVPFPFSEEEDSHSIVKELFHGRVELNGTLWFNKNKSWHTAWIKIVHKVKDVRAIDPIFEHSFLAFGDTPEEAKDHFEQVMYVEVSRSVPLLEEQITYCRDAAKFVQEVYRDSCTHRVIHGVDRHPAWVKCSICAGSYGAGLDANEKIVTDPGWVALNHIPGVTTYICPDCYKALIETTTKGTNDA